MDNMNTKLKKWIRWLAVIHNDIVQLLINQDIFWEIQEIIKNNSKIQKPSSFYRYLGSTYIAYVTIGIRRQIKIKINGQSISFCRLLTEISENPSVLSRSYYKSLYKNPFDEHLADEKFDGFVATNKDYISPKMVLDDCNELKKTAFKVEDFTDKRIAHHDTSEPKFPLTFQEVDDCLDKLDKLYCKYHLIFHAVDMQTLRPVYTYNWKEIFCEPWLPNNEATGNAGVEI